MFTGQGSIVIGYRWKTYGGSQACKQCAELNGREFYLNPGPGQTSTLDMPQPPLHPSCGCKLMEIIDVAQVAGRPGGLDEAEGPAAVDGQPPQENGTDDDPGIRPYMIGMVVRDPFFGGLWRKNAILKGPIYRKYGGLEWTAGKDVSEGNEDIKNYPPAEDDMDEIFKQHDLCYKGNKENKSTLEIACDLKLVDGLKSLQEDPRYWWSETKMTPREVQDAINYRSWALWHFGNKTARYFYELRDCHEWGYCVEGTEGDRR